MANPVSISNGDCPVVSDRVPMNNSKGAAFYASGNVAGEALGLYSADLWTEAYAAKAVRDDEQRM